MNNPYPMEGDDLNAALNQIDNPIPTGTRLTQSQEQASGQLESLLKLRLMNTSVLNFRPRTHGLIAGPSGAGKSSVVRAFCDRLHLPLLSVTIGNWILQGAHNSNHTLTRIAGFIHAHPAGVILLDEVDKLSSEFVRSHAWTSAVSEEVYALLDADARLLTAGFPVGVLERLRSRYLVLGAGAWQHHWNEAGEDKVGDYLRAIQERSGLADEFLFRFNERVVVVEPPNQSELESMIKSLHQALGLPLGDAPKRVAAEALARRQSLRFVEAYIGDLLLQANPSISTQSLLGRVVSETTREEERMFLGETPQEAFKRITQQLQTTLGDFHRCCEDLSASMGQWLDEDVRIIYRAWAIDTENSLDQTLMGLQDVPLDEVPSTTHIEQRLKDLSKERQRLVREMRGAVQLLGKAAQHMARPGIRKSEFCIFENLFRNYGKVLRNGLTGLREKGEANRLSAPPVEVLGRWAKLFDRCQELHALALDITV